MNSFSRHSSAQQGSGDSMPTFDGFVDSGEGRLQQGAPAAAMGGMMGGSNSTGGMQMPPDVSGVEGTSDPVNP